MSQLRINDWRLAPSAGMLIGVDEAGRGALAGPVVVAAVILNPERQIDGLDDSKKLSARRRSALYEEITARCLAWRVVEVSEGYIDRHNILQATLYGMRQAVEALAGGQDLCLVDGNALPPGLPCQGLAVVGGDGLHECVAAASILAKVHRDRLMVELGSEYPQYAFGKHKGYGTAEHLSALRLYGPCPAHRMTFAPVSQLTLDLD